MQPKKTHYQSIRWRLIISIVPVLLVAAVFIMLAVYYISRDAMINTTDELLLSQSETAAAKISGWADVISSQIDLTASLIEDETLSTPTDISNYILSHIGTLKNCDDGLYVVFNHNGLTLDKSGYSESNPDLDTAALSESWYQFGFSQEEVGFDGCSSYEENGNITYSVTITRQLRDKSGAPTGIIATDAYLGGMSDLLSTIRTGSSETLLLDSKSAMVIGATQKDFVGYSSGQGNSFADALIADMEKGNFSTRYPTAKQLLFTSVVPVSGTPWYLVSYVERSKALETLNPLLTASVIGIIILAVIIILIVLRVSSSQMKPLVHSKNVITKVSGGDFTVEIPETKTKTRNEITEINEGLREFIFSLRALLHDVSQTASLIEKHSDSFQQMAASLNQDAATENTALHELTDNIHQITDSIQILAGHATSLAALAADTKSDSLEANSKMENAVLASHKTADDIRTISVSIQSTEQSMSYLSKLVQEVQANTNQIDSITEVIKSIADQTNLLSLNASIEAARAGESGRGFAVVADEIKHLAEDSSRNAAEITEHIHSITNLIASTAASTEQSLSEVTESAKLMGTLSSAFDEMSHTLTDASQVLSMVNKNIEQVSDISSSIAAISEEQAASSEEILSTTLHIEELVNQTKEHSDVLQQGTINLTDASENLKEYMNKFIL